MNTKLISATFFHEYQIKELLAEWKERKSQCKNLTHAKKMLYTQKQSSNQV